VADIVRACRTEFLDQQGSSLSAVQHRVLNALANCRTAALGGHVERCDHCEHERIAYNSCRNRHCPKCLAAARARWLEREASYLLPVEYHHVVFTLPEALRDVAWQNQAVVYGLLFRAAVETLRELAADPHYLGAQLGIVAVLHTWGQNLHYHPHLHCIVSGGGLACDVRGKVHGDAKWIACRPGFFLPVRVLSRLFRGKFLALLQKAHTAGKLSWHGKLAGLADQRALQTWLTPLYQSDWVVHVKPPFGGPEQVLKYLARYTHRVAITNHRLVAFEDGRVTFRYKDYKHHGQQRRMTLEAGEFVRRFLQHVLPRGFVKIRHYGLLANRRRKQNLARCRLVLLAVFVPSSDVTPAPTVQPPSCPMCGHGVLRRAYRISRPSYRDTS